MADGVTFQSAAAATPPAATKVATDDAGADGQVQIIKLAISTDGSATVIPATASWGLGVDIKRHGVTGIGTGRKTVTTAGTRVVLAASTTAKFVVITAMEANTGIIVVGGTSVVALLASREGTPLWARDSVTLPVDDLNDVNLDATVSGEGVVFTYFT